MDPWTGLIIKSVLLIFLNSAEFLILIREVEAEVSN